MPRLHAEINAPRSCVKTKRENADNVASREDKRRQKARLHQSTSAKFHTN